MPDLSLVFDLLARDRASDEVKKVGESFQKAGKESEGFSGTVKDVFGELGGAALGGGLAVGAAFFGAVEQQGQTQNLAAQLGWDPGQAAAAGKLAGEVYAGNYGDSMEQVNDAIGAVASSLSGLGSVGSSAMKGATQDALTFAQVFDVDVGEGAQIAGNLIKNGLAKDATGAFDLMTAGFQRVPAAMREELPDILNEYGTNFRALGFTGEQAFGLLTNAAQNGQFVLDKTGDALKEFTIRGSDMSTASVAAYQAIGLNAGKMSDAVAKGGPPAQAALQKTAAALLKVKDPSDRANQAIALFGTPLEDLSVDQIPQFLSSIANVGPGLTGAAGAADRMSATVSSGIGPALETLKRTATTTATQGMGSLIAGFRDGKTDAGGWQGTAQNLAASVSGVLSPALSGLGTFLSGTVSPALHAVFGFLADHQTTVTVIAGVIAAVLTPAIIAWGVSSLVSAAQSALGWTTSTLAASAGAISQVLSVGRVVAGWVLMGVQSLLQAARMAAAWVIAMGPVGWVIAAVIGLVALIVANWDKVKGWTVDAFHAVSGAVGAAFDWIKGAVSAALGFLVNLFLNFTGPGLIIKHWDDIKRFTSDAWNAVTGFVSGAWNKMTGAISNGVGAAVSFVKNLPGDVVRGLGNIGSTLYEKGKELLQGLLNGAGSVLRNIGKFFLDLVPGWIRGPFEHALGISSPSTVFADYGQSIGQGLLDGLRGMRPAVADELAALADTSALASLRDMGGVTVGGGGGLGYSPPGYDMPPGGAPGGGGASYYTTVTGVASPEQVAREVVAAQRTNEFLTGGAP